MVQLIILVCIRLFGTADYTSQFISKLLYSSVVLTHVWMHLNIKRSFQDVFDNIFIHIIAGTLLPLFKDMTLVLGKLISRECCLITSLHVDRSRISCFRGGLCIACFIPFIEANAYLTCLCFECLQQHWFSFCVSLWRRCRRQGAWSWWVLHGRMQNTC